MTSYAPAVSGAIQGGMAGGIPGAIVGGAMGLFSTGGDPVTKTNIPYTLPPPSPLGGFQTNNVGWTRDPVTGVITQQDYNFDPTQMWNQLNTQNMMNQFNYGNNWQPHQVEQLDAQMDALKQQLAQMQQGGSQAKNVQNISDVLTGLDATFIDPKTGGAWSESKLLQEINDKNPNLYKMYFNANPRYKGEQWKLTSYSKGRERIGEWVKDYFQKNIIPKVTALSTAQENASIAQGNTGVNTRGIQDLQNQIHLLEIARENNYKSDNPLTNYMTNIGARWEGKDNTNPFAGEMDRITADKLAHNGASPETGDMREYYKKLMGATGTPGESSWEAMLKNSVGAYTPQLLGEAQQLKAQHFDPGAARAMLASMNAGTDSAQEQARKQRDAIAASRGMLGSSGAVNELADANGGIQNYNQKLQNQFQAMNYGNQQLDRQFGQEAQAANANNASAAQFAGANNSANYQKALLGLNASAQGQSMNNQNVDNIMRAFNAYQMGNNQDWSQMMGALGASNQMSDNSRARDVQDYGFGREENNTFNQRASDMWNRLQGANQLGIQNKQAQQGLNTGAAAQSSGVQLAVANNFNNANVANAQMNNSTAMADANRRAAANIASNQQWTNTLGALGNGVASYFGSQGKTNNTQTAPTEQDVINGLNSK